MYYYSCLAVIIIIPLASIQHFIEPLSNCLLADICNHTWIPECGNQGEDDYRMFIDECDMYEYNCDFKHEYVIVNYSDCFRPFTGCPTHKSFFRVGDYKYLLQGRKIIYEPTDWTKPIGRTILTTTRRTTLATTRHGKRRYTPEAKKKVKHRATTRKVPRATNRKVTTSHLKVSFTPGTVVLTRYEVIKNGMKFYKVIKGYPTTTQKYDSEFLE